MQRVHCQHTTPSSRYYRASATSLRRWMLRKHTCNQCQLSWLTECGESRSTSRTWYNSTRDTVISAPYQ